VAEDEASVRKLAVRMLRQLGYTVLEVLDGLEAITVASQHPDRIHLLLTDVVMPNCGGKVAAERIRRDRPDLRVLYMSGYTDNAIVHHGVLDTDTQFLPKPFPLDDLARRVREVLDGES